MDTIKKQDHESIRSQQLLLQSILVKMQERFNRLHNWELEQSELDYPFSFNPSERSGELQIWFLEINDQLNKLNKL